MGRMSAVMALALLLPTTGIPGTESVPTVATGTGAFGAIGVIVDDGIGYAHGAAAARTPNHIVQELTASGLFASVSLNSFDLPQQLRVKIRKKPSGSEAEATGKLIGGAATLFLVPMKQSYDYSVEFEVECRGRTLGAWSHVRTVEQTQFLLADPNTGVPELIKEAVSQFLKQAVESGKLGGCN